ncbi:glycoside hydrolase family 16 protein [Shewanella khirikhana]|uniref:glycoside hydrolase family 16 protein n=1 Tax=Shewanella khirikhana TaxID=1965282 RepID=UPI0030D1A53A
MKSTLTLTLAACFTASLAQAANYELVWSDEFDGNSLDQSKWSYQLGDGCDIGLCGWGNNEREYYKEANVTVSGGLLTLTAKKERTKGSAYSSGRIRSIFKGDFKYGRVEARMKLPAGQGLWPAFWMLPTEETYGGWAASGEIDIMEAVNLGGTGANEVHGTLHFGAPWPDNQYVGQGHSPSTSVTENFHTYRVDWEPDEIRWYVDDVLYQTQTQWSSTGGDYPAPFNKDFYILLNLAVGGHWPGDPDSTTPFPSSIQVDWVRVWQDPAISGGGGVDPEPVASQTQVSGISTDYRRMKGSYAAQVTVSVGNELGGAVAGALESGSLSGSYNETLSGTTDSAGNVQLQSAGTLTSKGPYEFCVTDISHAELSYNPAGNTPTCSSAP